MNENEIAKKELNFFQKIRKSFYLRGMKPKKAWKYNQLPDYLKNDQDVIEAVVSADNTKINDIPIGNMQEIIKIKPELIDHIWDIQKKAIVLEKNPEAIQFVNQNDVYTIIYNKEINSTREFIKFLPEDIQKKMLTENIRYTDKLKRENSLLRREEANQDFGFKSELPIEQFSEEIIIKIALEDKKAKKQNPHYITILESLKVEKLPIETQLKLLLVDNQNASIVSPETVQKFVKDNPLLMDILPIQQKETFLAQNPEFVKKLSKNQQRNFIDLGLNNTSIKTCFDVRGFETPDDAKKELMRKSYAQTFSIDTIAHIFDIRNDEYIWELSKFDPIVLKMAEKDYSSNLNDLYRIQKVIENMAQHAKTLEPDGKITDFLSGMISSNHYACLSIRKANYITKFLTNEDIMKSVGQDEIYDYIGKLVDFEINNNNSIPSNKEEEYEEINKKLVEIVRKTYGDESAKILEDRPQAGLKTIPNFYVFHPEIIKEFGIGAVHATLSYNSNIPGEFSELARNPIKMEEFRKFDKSTEGMFEDSAIGLDKKLRAFEISKELMKDVKDKTLTDKQIENLELAINEQLSNQKQNVMDFPKNLEELDAYKIQRDKIYDEAIQKTTDIHKLKELISQRFFGLDYTTDSHTVDLKENSVIDMCRFYNIKNFVNDERTLNSELFSEEDLDALEVLDIIASIKNPKILKELSNTLSKNQNILTPTHYKKLQDKVPMQYSKELVDSFINPNKLEKMIANGEEGLELREEDGIKIITLKGADFCAYVTNPFMNNSHIKDVEKDNLVKTWKKMENGISTFSGCVISQDMPKSCVSQGQMGLGVSLIAPEQIVGMGITDIHVSHSSKDLNYNTSEKMSVNYEYPDDLLRETAKRLYTSEDKKGDSMHAYNEVASARREQKLSEITEDTFGGKIMPDYIYVYGKNLGSSGIKLAKEFGVEYIIEYDEDYYRGRANQKALETKKAMKPREKSEFMSQIQAIVENEEDEYER